MSQCLLYINSVHRLYNTTALDQLLLSSQLVHSTQQVSWSSNCFNKLLIEAPIPAIVVLPRQVLERHVEAKARLPLCPMLHEVLPRLRLGHGHPIWEVNEQADLHACALDQDLAWHATLPWGGT